MSGKQKREETLGSIEGFWNVLSICFALSSLFRFDSLVPCAILMGLVWKQED